MISIGLEPAENRAMDNRTKSKGQEQMRIPWEAK